LLDYHRNLPLFFDGLRETEEPHWCFSFCGALDPMQRDGDISGFGQRGSFVGFESRNIDVNGEDRRIRGLYQHQISNSNLLLISFQLKVNQS
jgi:hypothetical protein